MVPGVWRGHTYVRHIKDLSLPPLGPPGLGVRLVVVLGAAPQIDTAIAERGLELEFHGSYRITRADVLEAAVEAAGRTRTAVERYLSRAPSVPVFRRHAKDDGEMHFGPALQVVGLYVGVVAVCWGVGSWMLFIGGLRVPVFGEHEERKATERCTLSRRSEMWRFRMAGGMRT